MKHRIAPRRRAETKTHKRATMAGEEDDQTMHHADEGEESDESETGNVGCEALENEVGEKQDGRFAAITHRVWCGRNELVKDKKTNLAIRQRRNHLPK
jgi:hypothetical protein